MNFSISWSEQTFLFRMSSVCIWGLVCIGAAYFLFQNLSSDSIKDRSIATIEFSSAPNINPSAWSQSWWLLDLSGSTNSWVVLTGSSIALESKKEVQKVFKIQTYSENWDWWYSYSSYWSAILIWKNQILTNAHVIMWSDDMPTWKYNLCITTSDADEPICVTWLRLMKYDILKDIALLEPIDTVYLWSPLELIDRKLELGETIKVYGYPSNGGSTLSLTEWKMSGTEKWYYKVDANIDHGNSWGGAFDKNDIFVGMPYIAQTGLTTMGYIIPVKMINEFLSDTANTSIYSEDQTTFQKYIKNINNLLKEQEIKNPFFTFDGFTKLGFTLTEISWDINQWFGRYVFSSVSANTVITIDIPYIQGNNYFSFTWMNTKIEKQFQNVKSEFNIEEYGKKIYEKSIVTGKKKSNGTIDNNYGFYLYDMWRVTYFINSTANTGEQKDIQNAIQLFNKNLKIINANLATPSKTIQVFSGSFESPKNTNIMRRCREKCSYEIYVNPLTRVRFSQINMPTTKLSELTFDEFSKKLKKYFNADSTSWEIIMEPRKNKNWLQYLYSKWTQDDWTISISALFYWKETDNKAIQYEFSMKLESGNVIYEALFNSLIDTFSTQLHSPFSKNSSTTKELSNDINHNSTEISSQETIDEQSITKSVDHSQNITPIPENIPIARAQVNRTIDYCKVTFEGVEYLLDPCSINETMYLSDWDKSFQYSIVPSDTNTDYSYAVYGYGEWFPTYGILWGTSGSSRWIESQNPYFSSKNLKEWMYNGYLKVKISWKNGASARELRLKINLNVLP